VPAGGSSKKHKFTKKKRVKTNKVVYDDPSTHSCLCCEEYDTDCEPTYPCSDFRELQLWDKSRDQKDDHLQRVPCEQMPGQFCRSCDDDECIDKVTICATLEISYQHSNNDVIGTKEESDGECVELSNSDCSDNADRVQNSGVEMINEGEVQHFQGMSTCTLKPKWTRRRSRCRRKR
jgi:hypothetical protein